MTLKVTVGKIAAEMRQEAADLKGEGPTGDYMHMTLIGYARALEAACDASGGDESPTGDDLGVLLTQHLSKADQTRKSVERQQLDERLRIRAEAEEGLGASLIAFVGGPMDGVMGPGLPPSVPRIVGQTRTQAEGAWYVLGEDGCMHFEKMVVDG